MRLSRSASLERWVGNEPEKACSREVNDSAMSGIMRELRVRSLGMHVRVDFEHPLKPREAGDHRRGQRAREGVVVELKALLEVGE